MMAARDTMHIESERDEMHRRAGYDAHEDGMRCTPDGFWCILQRDTVNNVTGGDAQGREFGRRLSWKLQSVTGAARIR
jgi:hypothetical protein